LIVIHGTTEVVPFHDGFKLMRGGGDVRAGTPAPQPAGRPALQFRRAAAAWRDHLP
jgi:hypothetical protein